MSETTMLTDAPRTRGHQESTMTITARYPGRCATCGGPIAAGSKIQWSKGGGARHVACGAPPAAAPSGACAKCGGPKSAWEIGHGIRLCIDCRDGGGNARGGQSYYDRHGRYVLGDDD